MNRLQPTTALFTTIVLITIIEAFIKPLVYMVKGFIKLMKPFNLGKELYECTPHEFELVCSIILKENKFKNIKVSPCGPDGGVDIRCQLNGEEYFVECKRYLDDLNAKYVVDADIVRKLLGAMAGSNVKRGIIMTTGRISNDAREFIATLPEEYKIICYDSEFFNMPIANFNTDKILLMTSS